MSPELKAISKLVPPPDNPQGRDRSWQDVQTDLARKLPADYKQFIDLYGSGLINGQIFVFNFRDTKLFERPLPEELCGEHSFIQGYERDRAMGGHDWPYAMYPEPGGLLPFATLFEIDTLNWATHGPPNRWDVVYWMSDGQEF